MQPFSIEHIAKSSRHVLNLSFTEKEKLIDTVFKTQPKLLGEVVILSKLDIPYEKIDHIFHILMVLYHCFVIQGGQELPIVTEELLESVGKNTMSMFKLFENEPPDERDKLLKLSIENHPEKNVLAFLVGYLEENGFSDNSKGNKYCVLAAKNIFDSLVEIKRIAFLGHKKKRG